MFRWGGEEMLVLMGANKEQSYAAAERIRREIAANPVVYRENTEVAVTVTIGLASYRKGCTIQDLMDEADEKLYYGKRHGKNRVVDGDH